MERRKKKQRANNDNSEKMRISEILEKSPWYGGFTAHTPQAKNKKDNQQQKAKTNRD